MSWGQWPFKIPYFFLPTSQDRVQLNKVQIKEGTNRVLQIRYNVKDVSLFSPSRLRHNKPARAALILLEVSRISVSYSLASSQGALLFRLPFHCLLLNQANYDQFSGVSQCLRGVARVPQEKRETHKRWHHCSSQTQGEQQECSLCYHIQFIDWEMNL